jgi:hypothetical protein
MVAPGRPPTPGPRSDEAALRHALEPILALAAEDTVGLDHLSGHPELCLCAARTSADGEWMRGVFLQPTETSGVDPSADSARSETARLLGRVVATGSAGSASNASVAAAFRRLVGFGDFIYEDPIAAGIASAEVWRGTILRNYSVGAWRRIWSWLVEQLGEPLSPDTLADLFAESLPAMRVSELLEEIPHGAGPGESVEEDLRSNQPAPDPLTELRMLALGAQRLHDLEGRALQAFVGSERADDLGPAWVAAQMRAYADRPLPDFARWLARLMVDRAFRVALSKMQLDKHGGVWMPSRIVDRGGLISRRSREGWADVGLRIDTFSSVLLGCGVFDIGDDGWFLTDLGAAALA